MNVSPAVLGVVGTDAVAAALCHRLGLPAVAGDDPRPGLRLRADDARGLALEWRPARAGGRGRRVSHRLRIELDAVGSGRELPLVARAAGLHRGVREVVDATAGLGRDAAALIAAGATVTMVERDPVLGALLDDALRRLASTAPERAARLRLRVDDAAVVLAERTVEAVLLDPMFEGRGKSAAPRLDMQICRALLGSGAAADTALLLGAARRACTRRAVLKRLPKAPTLHLPDAPVAVLRGGRARFDIYRPTSPNQSCAT